MGAGFGLALDGLSPFWVVGFGVRRYGFGAVSEHGPTLFLRADRFCPRLPCPARNRLMEPGVARHGGCGGDTRWAVWRIPVDYAGCSLRTANLLDNRLGRCRPETVFALLMRCSLGGAAAVAAGVPASFARSGRSCLTGLMIGLGNPRAQGVGVSGSGDGRGLQGPGLEDKTRRTDPTRVSRHWLVLSVATLGPGLWRVEDAQERRIAPGNLRAPPKALAPNHRDPWSRPARTVSVIRHGIDWLGKGLRSW